jgi:hypothetical protein
MQAQDSNPTPRQGRKSGFRISGGPVISNAPASSHAADHVQLPTSYGAPIVFAIPRDPHTIFTYWNIDWSEAFARTGPTNQTVYLRVKRGDGSDELEEPVEPMLGTHFVMVAQPRGTYQVELGFYEAGDVWNSIATSDPVTMPADSVSENGRIDLATVPFHLSFQRMIDLFRASTGDAITSLVTRLQDRALDAGSDQERLSAEERELLAAMNISMADVEQGRRTFQDSPASDLLRRRAEALLNFGGTSPGVGLGGSSWTSGS